MYIFATGTKCRDGMDAERCGAVFSTTVLDRAASLATSAFHIACDNKGMHGVYPHLAEELDPGAMASVAFVEPVDFVNIS